MTPAESPEDVPRLFAEAWNSRNASALANLFAEDADFVNVVGLWWHNRADIEHAHEYGLQTFFKSSQLIPRRVEVRQLGGDAAVVHVRWKLMDQLDNAGKTLDPRFTIMVFVLHRQDTGWIVVAAHNTEVIPGAETFVATDDKLDAVDYRQ